MFLSASVLPADARGRIVASLNGRLADSLALYSAAKTAHWNVKGPHANALHKLFDELAGASLSRADEIAERVTALGGLAEATPPVVAATSQIASYPLGLVDGVSHVRELHARYAKVAIGLRETRALCDDVKDRETAQYLDAALFDVEHEAGFLSAHLDTVPVPPRAT